MRNKEQITCSFFEDFNYKISVIAIASPARFEPGFINEGLQGYQNNLKINEIDSYLYQSCYQQNYYETLKPKSKALELIDALNDSSDLVMILRGGYSTNFALPYLQEKQALITKKKLIMGHSDLTILLNYLAKNNLVKVWHGPMLSGIEQDDIQTINEIKKVIDHQDVITPITPIKSNNKGVMITEIYGGNLTLITGAIGTKWEIDLNDMTLFIEEVNEPDWKIDAMLWQLTNHYDLSKCHAIIFGTFKGCNEIHDAKHKGIYQIFKNYTKDLKIPIIYQYPSGHEYPQNAIPLGQKVKLDLKTGNILL